MSQLNVKPRTMFCKDNIDVLRGINSDCIDLIYLDPPFNKKKVFTASIGSSAEGAEFSDIFREEDVKDEWVDSIECENPELYCYLAGVKTFSNKYNYCYLVYMAIRLIECHRVLKETGTLYLHCDSTMSHYLKVVLDSIFGEKHFRNEIIWCYSHGGKSKTNFARKHDTIFRYSKSGEFVFNGDAVGLPRDTGVKSKGGKLGKDEKGRPYQDKIVRKTGKIYRYYLDSGKIPEDYWTDINSLQANSEERTGYPTQKPLALLERLIKASSNKGDVVLDPFCGCATACVAAERLGRKWIGVDVSYKAYELVNKRIEKMYAEQSATSATTPLLSGGYTEALFLTDPPMRGKDGKQAHGYVYIISNSNWAGTYKVGIAKDPKRRLNSYQTSDPYRAYKLEYSLKTPYFREIEQYIHASFKAANEWIAVDLKKIKRAIKERDNFLHG